MTSEPDHEFLSRAARELREAPEPGWPETAERLVAAARAATRRSVPLRARYAPDPLLDQLPGRVEDRLTISDQVLLPLLRQAAATVSGCTAAAIGLTVEDGICTGASLQVTAGFGTDLAAAGAELRAVLQVVLRETLGPVPAVHRVDVAFIDVREV